MFSNTKHGKIKLLIVKETLKKYAISVWNGGRNNNAF